MGRGTGIAPATFSAPQRRSTTELPPPLRTRDELGAARAFHHCPESSRPGAKVASATGRPVAGPPTCSPVGAVVSLGKAATAPPTRAREASRNRIAGLPYFVRVSFPDTSQIRELGITLLSIPNVVWIAWIARSRPRFTLTNPSLRDSACFCFRRRCLVGLGLHPDHGPDRRVTAAIGFRLAVAVIRVWPCWLICHCA